MLALSLSGLLPRPGSAQGAPAAPAPPARGSAGPTRLPNGAPGPGYWQQQVDYALEATLDPVRRQLAGRGVVTYHNNSPAPLAELRWHLHQNIFRTGGPASVVGRAMTRTQGIAVTRVAAGGRALAPVVSGTIMRTALPTPIAPGDSLRVEVAWTLDVPGIASLRTGSVGEEFGMAQWYPQVSTYDDVHGWHDLPYRGQGEFYLEYGNWDVRLTLPRRFTVAATGTLMNPEAVLSARQATALRAVAAAPPGHLTRVLAAADTGDLGAPGIDAPRTWHFSARQVRDFAWAASPHFLWNATRTGPLAARPGGVLIHSFFTANKAAHYEQSWDVARRTIEFFSSRFGDYLYPQATVVSGPVEGMEYPMLAFEGVEAGPATAYMNFPELVTVHELGHQWYPMMIGSNETRHAFMDEGFTTFIEMEWFAARHGGKGFWSARMPGWLRGLAGAGDHRRLNYAQIRIAQPTVPLLTPADAIPETQVGSVAYQKPAAALVMLRDVIGAPAMNAALNEYYRRWQFKHPYPDDFFRTVESVAGRDLGWFWDAWFRRTGRLDLALASVGSAERRGAWRATLEVRNRGTIAMPATVRLTLADGSTRTVRLEERAWRPGDSAATLQAAGLPSAVRAAELDPAQLLLDADRSNNVWPAGARPAAGPLLGVGGWGLLGLLGGALLVVRLARAVGLVDGLRMSRFRLVRAAFGGFSVWTRHGGVRPRRIPRPRLYGRGALALPPPGSDPAPGMARLESAGSLWVLFAGVILAPVAFLLERRADGGLRPGANFLVDSFVVLAAAAAAVSFLRALLPRRPRGGYIAAAPWVRLLARPGSPAMQRWSAMRALVAQSFDDVRPRAWSPAWVRRATALSDGSAAEAGACMLAYLWALDRGEAAEAGVYLERARAAAARRWWRFRIRRHVNAENAFYTGYVEGDVEGGWHLLRRTSARLGPRHVRRRAEAALRVGRGELAKADRVARRGLLSDPRTAAWGGEGVATFERYWLAVLLAAADRRVGAAVVTPKPGQVGLYALRR